jgi:putative NIF3 family GTP cyclohydrolase 1 type 2
MDLKLINKLLQEYGKPSIACNWDNVGLLVEPSEKLFVKKILVTTDLTQKVFDEALKKNINLIISYHPIIVNPLKRLTQAEWEQRSIIKCLI